MKKRSKTEQTAITQNLFMVEFVKANKNNLSFASCPTDNKIKKGLRWFIKKDINQENNLF